MFNKLCSTQTIQTTTKQGPLPSQANTDTHAQTETETDKDEPPAGVSRGKMFTERDKLRPMCADASTPKTTDADRHRPRVTRTDAAGQPVETQGGRAAEANLRKVLIIYQ